MLKQAYKFAEAAYKKTQQVQYQSSTHEALHSKAVILQVIIAYRFVRNRLYFACNNSGGGIIYKSEFSCDFNSQVKFDPIIYNKAPEV